MGPLSFSLQPCLGNLEASNWDLNQRWGWSAHSHEPQKCACFLPKDVLLRTMEGHTIGKDRIISNAKVVHIWAKVMMLGPGVKMLSLAAPVILLAKSQSSWHLHGRQIYNVGNKERSEKYPVSILPNQQTKQETAVSKTGKTAKLLVRKQEAEEWDWPQKLVLQAGPSESTRGGHVSSELLERVTFLFVKVKPRVFL